MQNVRGNVRPELAEDVGQSVAALGVRVLDRALFRRPVITGILGSRDPLGDSPT